MKKQVAVIGGGAAGLTAAIWAARSGASAVILEHTDRVGKKILSTGNGRCNLTNSKMEASCYRSGDPQFPMEVISQFGWKDTLRWFSSMGLLCRCRMESYYYPMSDQASAVLDCLRMECSRLGITIRTGIQPERIQRMREGRRSFYEIMTDQGEVRADAVILACGSKAAPNTGSDGSGYELAKSLGHRIIKPLPALVQLRCQGNHYRQLAGIRTEADLRLLVNDREMWRERGELQITDYGISGIPVFQLSRFAARGMDEGKKVRVMIDFLPFMDKKESRIFLEQRFAEFGDRNGEDFLTGVLHKKLAAVLLKMAGIRLDQPVQEPLAHAIFPGFFHILFIGCQNPVLTGNQGICHSPQSAVLFFGSQNAQHVGNFLCLLSNLLKRHILPPSVMIRSTRQSQGSRKSSSSI